MKLYIINNSDLKERHSTTCIPALVEKISKELATGKNNS